MKKIIIIFALFIFSFTPSFATDSYFFESGAGYSYYDDENNNRINEINGHLRFAFNKIMTKNHPLYECAFLEKASYFDISAERNVVNTPSDTEIFSGKSKGYTLNLLIKYLLPMSPVIINTGISKLKLENERNVTYRATNFNLGLGVYIAYGLLTGFDFNRTTSEYSSILLTGEKIDIYSLYIKYLRELNDTNSFNVETRFTRSKDKSPNNKNHETIDTYEAIADFYLNRHLGFGGAFSYDNSSVNTDDSRTFSARVIFFPVDQLCLLGGYSKVLATHSGGTNEDRIFLKTDFRL
jgi:hypothetical protein